MPFSLLYTLRIDLVVHNTGIMRRSYDKDVTRNHSRAAQALNFCIISMVKLYMSVFSRPLRDGGGGHDPGDGDGAWRLQVNARLSHCISRGSCP